MGSSENGSPQVSVVVAAKNSATTIGPLLDALEAQTLPREAFQLVVVDDGSTDDTRKLVEARGWVDLVALDRNLGAPMARNAGVEAAGAALIAFTDADCVPDPTWLERGLERFRGDPGLEMLGGLVFVTMDERPSVAALIDGARFLNQEDGVRSGTGLTANLWLGKGLFLSVGGFNQRLAKLGYPDTELTELLSSQGARFEYAEDVRVSHPARASWAELARKGYRLGVGYAKFRRFRRANGGAPPRPIFLQPRRLLPRASIVRIDRLAKRGIEVGPWKRCQMGVVEIICLSIPMLVGDLLGTWRELWSRERPTDQSP
jgi:glycosyltransferase involved in cell wall biosynthesis